MKKINLLLLFVCSMNQLFAQVSWQQMASLPGSARHHAIAFSHGTKGYVLTGESTVQMKDFWEYNSATNIWTQLPSYPGVSRSYGIGNVIGDKAYIGFGYSGSTQLTDWWEYDFNTANWTQKNNFPGAGRDHPCSAVLFGKLYMGFGDNSGGSIRDWWEYTPATDTWVTKTNYPGVAMHHPVTASSSTLIYLSEGHLVSGTVNKGSKDFYSYDPINDTWATLTNMPGLGVVAGASFCLGNTKVYSGAGITEPVENFHNEFYEYDIAANTWTAIDAFPGEGMFAPVSFVIGDAGYVVTGTNALAEVKDLFRLGSSVLVPNFVTREKQLIVYPNPASDRLSLSLNAGNEPTHVALFDVLGHEAIAGTVLPDANANYDISVENLPSGIYFLKVGTQNHVIVRKVIIQKN